MCCCCRSCLLRQLLPQPGAQQPAIDALFAPLCARSSTHTLQWIPGDRGACQLSGNALHPIQLTHFGMHTTPTNNFPAFGHQGHPGEGAKMDSCGSFEENAAFLTLLRLGCVKMQITGASIHSRTWFLSLTTTARAL